MTTLLLGLLVGVSVGLTLALRVTQATADRMRQRWDGGGEKEGP